MTSGVLVQPTSTRVDILVGPDSIAGDLVIPRNTTGIVIFAHGSGSGRFSSRNRFVARALNAGGLATLLLDLLTAGAWIRRRDSFDLTSAPVTGRRCRGLVAPTRVRKIPDRTVRRQHCPAAALVAEPRQGAVGAVVSDGRPDGGRVQAPALFTSAARTPSSSS
jgi:hypothetical protein